MNRPGWLALFSDGLVQKIFIVIIIIVVVVIITILSLPTIQIFFYIAAVVVNKYRCLNRILWGLLLRWTWFIAEEFKLNVWLFFGRPYPHQQVGAAKKLSAPLVGADKKLSAPLVGVDKKLSAPTLLYTYIGYTAWVSKAWRTKSWPEEPPKLCMLDHWDSCPRTGSQILWPVGQQESLQTSELLFDTHLLRSVFKTV